MFKNNVGVLFISLAVIISSIIGGLFFYQAQKPQNTIKTVGIASHQFTADTIKWNITLEEKVGPDHLKKGYQKLDEQIKNLRDILKNNGIELENIDKKPINVNEEYEYKNNNGSQEKIFSGYRLSQNLYVVSKKVDSIENLVYNPVSLLDNNINARHSNLQYYYSKIDELKKDIIGKAAANAEERAEKMLENTDMKIGKTISLNSGVFQITEPNSTRVSSSGIYQTSTRKKEIKVTVHATYLLK